ncbi:high-affinity nicotinic acid transporter [Verticillium alfalfae VaMs.102]|uniref:High-affinity nicotinic acid transporter n=1 Tax=Verticillium alfalfae (strain VaMs.102 / ATCC MYA-4576 / FGSC 10136) TaxID=526221 RepID=C9SWB0_VERA1|nr:high-affinity nicotinic acid transporter [Verticillium alfalfae VaMs.102]EEY23075.1 high-affinity nicotinic acid transporter [Verticillium alfalfae VaMs.102]
MSTLNGAARRKTTHHTIGVLQVPGDGNELAQNSDALSAAEQKRALKKMDLRLVVFVGIMYCFSVIGRSALASASVAGMADDLQLVGNRFSVTIVVFFATYILFQPVSTIVARTIGPRLYFSAITLSSGLVVIGMGHAKSWIDMIVMRLLLAEVGSRFSWFYILVSVSYAFGGLLASGLTRMDGLGNLRGWSWIFMIDGIITCLIGLAGLFLLAEFPDTTKPSRHFLSSRELAWVRSRVNADRGDVAISKLTLRKLMRGGLDPKVWAFALIFFNNAVVNFALANFLPIILRKNMGFSVAKSQALVAPPYVFAAIVMHTVGWLGDRYRVRGPFLVAMMLLSITGTSLMGFHQRTGFRYSGVFLTAAGTTSAVPVTMAYQANNIRGQWKRAFSSALVVGVSGFGGIFGTLVFRSQDAPAYLLGLTTCLACAVLNILIVLSLTIYFYFANLRADRGEVELEISEEVRTQGFRHTL